MVNHHYDEATACTRCGECAGPLAFHVSANNAVSCPDCLDLLAPTPRQPKPEPTESESA